MNTQLVDALVQVILSLPTEERALLGENLATTNHLEASTNSAWTEEAVDAFLDFGRDAVPGCLKNTAVNYDRYLYPNPE